MRRRRSYVVVVGLGEREGGEEKRNRENEEHRKGIFILFFI